MDKIRYYLKVPVMANLMEDRRLGWAVLGAATLQGSLMVAGLPGWPCPFRHGLGIPCPGCGLSRAVAALCQADWELAFTYHAFVPIVMLAMLILIASSLTPEIHRQKLIWLVDRVERRTGLTKLILIGMLGYWLVRVLVFHAGYFDLIMG